MRAVVLVGGEGTRLRPITETMPKPLLPLMDRPSLDHVLDHLALHGVHEVVLSSSYLESAFHAFIEARHGDPRITWITEEQPLGTGGAIVNALEHVGDEPFFALNGDILTDLDLTAMLAFHRDRFASVTIALHHVEDARPFGLVPTEPDGRVLEFREKPTDLVPGDINAGTYLLDPVVLGEWPRGENLSIELNVFPAVIARRPARLRVPVGCVLARPGTPQKYLQAHFDILEGRVRGEPAYPAPFVAEGAEVDLALTSVGGSSSARARRVGAEAQSTTRCCTRARSSEAGARVVGVDPRAALGGGGRCEPERERARRRRTGGRRRGPRGRSHLRR